MTDCTGKYYSRGVSFHPIPLLQAEDFFTATCFYEVMRVTGGSCSFLEDHLYRLNESLCLSGVSFRLGINEVSAAIQGLISRNGLESGNIRLMVRVGDEEPPEWFSCCIPFSYPSAAQYELGVPTAIYHTARTNPNVKRYILDYQREMQSFIAERNIYEALLVDEHDLITEGSRSNVFFIRQHEILTAPGHIVLKGITREKVISICKKLKYNIIEKPVSIKDLNSIEAVFLTGTSPKVLPVNRVDDLWFRGNHPMMRILMEAYDRLILTETERSGRKPC